MAGNDKINEILNRVREKKERPAREFRSSRFTAIKDFFNQFKSSSRLTYIADKTDESGIDPRVVTYYSSDSPISEQYRILRTHIFVSQPDNPPKTILLTSCHRQEGKTLTAVNLAITLAQDSHKKVLLIDADLRKGEISKILNLSEAPGLAEVLKGQAELAEVIQEGRIPGVSVITAGANPLNPSELLGQAKIKESLRLIKESYDQIIIDAPPLIPVTDGALLAPLVDGIILVIKAEVTRLEIVEHAQFLLKQAKGKLLGYVLSNVEYHIPEYIHKYL